MENLVFLSHIHEESRLAVLIKEALEDEFSGFVKIFVSSDGITIPAGSNFLRRIEDGLANCKAGIYLISPYSVNRNWINFELGAVWIRNKLNTTNNLAELPAIPICHSGMTLSSLPQPVSNLNAIQGNIAAQLEFAFKSIQQSVGGKGRLKTDFGDLALKVSDFEREYTVGENFHKLFKNINSDVIKVYDYLENNPSINTLTLALGIIENSDIKILKEFENNQLKGYISVSTINPGIAFGPAGAINGAETNVQIHNTQNLLDYKNIILR